MTHEPSKDYQIDQIITIIWRNLPLYPSTFGDCWMQCGNGARGGGLCMDCAQKDLAKLVGAKRAKQYVKLVKEIRYLEIDMRKE